MISQLDPIFSRDVTIRDSGSVKQYRVVGIDGADPRFVVLADPSTRVVTHRQIARSRLQPVPNAEERTPEHRAGYLRLDSFGATADEATEWLAFVLLQAGMLFMNVPGGSDTRAELQRLLTVRGERADGPVVAAAMSYYDTANRIHEEMRAEFGDE